MTKTTEQIAQEHDVPIPETCQKLDWKKSTKLHWVGYKNQNEWEIIQPVEGDIIDDGFDTFPAPNTNKLFEALPKKIYGVGKFGIWQTCKIIEYEYKWIYMVGYEATIFEIEIQNNNLAEAFAKLYILLREKGLLPTT